MCNYTEDIELINEFIDLSLKQNLLTEMFYSVINEIRKDPEISLKDALVYSCIDLDIEPDEEPTEVILDNINDDIDEDDDLNESNLDLEQELLNEADRIDPIIESNKNEIEEFIDYTEI